MSGDTEADLDGPVVVIAREGGDFVTFIDPAPAKDSARKLFSDKNTAWGEALSMCRQHRCGLRDEADPRSGNRNAAK